ncbi:MAG: hypothetical protein GEV08_05170 [Acidimicrobiia bacterium]|nr:hypothetical protein [Acidimicrobiia bacterium]
MGPRARRRGGSPSWPRPGGSCSAHELCEGQTAGDHHRRAHRARPASGPRLGCCPCPPLVPSRVALRARRASSPGASSRRARARAATTGRWWRSRPAWRPSPCGGWTSPIARQDGERRTGRRSWWRPSSRKPRPSRRRWAPSPHR